VLCVLGDDDSQLSLYLSTSVSRNRLTPPVCLAVSGNVCVLCTCMCERVCVCVCVFAFFCVRQAVHLVSRNRRQIQDENGDVECVCVCVCVCVCGSYVISYHMFWELTGRLA